MIGVGVGVGFGGVGLSPAWLTAQVSTILGAKLLAMFDPTDAIVADGFITSLPAKVGPTLTNSRAAVFSVTQTNGRAMVNSNAESLQALSATGATDIKSVIMLITGATAAGSYDTWFSATNDVGFIMRNGTGTGFWTASSQISHYVDGSASEMIPSSGLHIVEGLFAATATGYRLGGSPVSANRPASAPWGRTIVLNAAPSASERAATVALLQRYYRL
jgi:hypothetical protein